MSRRSVLLLLAAAPLLVVASSGRSESGSASVTVTVEGVPSGYAVMARWLEEQLFARTVVPPKDGSAFSFSVQAPAGKGALKLWVLTMGQRGVNSATAVDATLRPGRHYTLAVTGDGAYSLRATVAEDPAVDVAQCHLTTRAADFASLRAARR